MQPDEVLRNRGQGQYALYDNLLKDGHCSSVLNTRQLAVIGKEWEVKAGGDDAIDQKAADMVTDQLKNLGCASQQIVAWDFDFACLNLLDALLKGNAIAEIMWGQDGKEFVATEIRPKNQQRFTFGLGEDGYELRLLTPENIYNGESLAKYPRKFICHSFGSKDGNPFGIGLGRSLWFPVFFKRQDIKYWLAFVDKFASPTAVGKYPNGASQEQKRTLLDALDAIAHDAGVIIPEGMIIELLEASRSGSISCYESLATYMDAEISKAVLGQTLTTQVGDRGSYAASQTHNDVRQDLVKADADLLSGTLNRTLCRWIAELNLPEAKPPQIWRKFDEVEDLNARANRDKTLFDMGWKLKKEAIAEIYGDHYEVAEQAEGDGATSDEEFLKNSGAAAPEQPADQAPEVEQPPPEETPPEMEEEIDAIAFLEWVAPQVSFAEMNGICTRILSLS